MAQKIFRTIMMGAMVAMCSCSKTPRESRGSDYDSFKAGFINPPMRARPKVYWWWLNGKTDTVRLREELLAMQQAGIGGVDIFEIGVPSYTNPDGMIPAGPAFMSEESKKTIKFAIGHATRLGFEVGLNVASSWNAGGSWTLPKNAAKSLYASRVKVTGPSKQNIALPFPAVPRTDSRNRPLLISFNADGKPAYYEDVAVLAIPSNGARPAQDTSQILNITTYFDARTEKLSWNPPSGEWNVYRYVCANSGEALKLPSPNSQAPIIDHYDSSATAAHFRFFMNELKPLLGDFSNTALKNLYLASYEATGSVWTSGLPAAFKKVNGYDIYKMIPALFDKNFFAPGAAGKFEDDFTRTLSELIINNHYRKAREICNQYGLKITSEAGGPGKPLHNVPVEALKALGSLDIPRGEFWNKHIHYDEDSIDIMWLVKEIAAASHIYRRKIVEEESFTSFQHWQEGPFDLKPLADRSFCEGMNRVVVHGFTHNPRGTGFPGIVYHAGTHYNDKRIWWPKIRPFNDYLARLSFVFQEADFKADVLYYYGDGVPKFVYPKNTKFKVGPGYDYEVINTEVLLRDLQVRDGKLTLPGGARFSALSLAAESSINPDVLKKLAVLAREGAVIIGDKPLAVAKDHGQPVSAETENLIDELWAPAGAS
ncbi:MAG TPA: glycosyl hydrolase, partial [Chryseosolibacter sp.]